MYMNYLHSSIYPNTSLSDVKCRQYLEFNRLDNRMLENISEPTWLCCVLLETVTAITTDLAEATLGFAVTQSSYA